MNKPWKAYGKYGSVGIELVLLLLLGTWAGWRGDHRFGTSPYLTLLGMTVGAYSGFRAIWKVSKDLERDVAAEEAKLAEEAPIPPPPPMGDTGKPEEPPGDA